MILKAQSFEFTSYNLDLNERKAYFRYTVHISDSEKIEFTETLSFPEVFLSEESLSHDLIHACLYNVHLILGISYWKLHCAPSISIPENPLSKNQAAFWSILYRKGLGEFFYINKINFKDLAQFPYESSASHEPVKVNVASRSLVGLGGGKDSIVAIEQLKEEKQDITGFVLEGAKESPIIHEVAKIASIPVIKVERSLDSKLLDLNSSGTVYNGHIPISAVYAFVGLLAAALYGYKSIIVANEKSADVGNATYLDEEINHQWSKTKEFELLFQNYTKEFITSSLEYRSILRSQSELSVIQAFTHNEKYFSVFSSCNRNFALTKSAEKRWCGECPKCAFVFAGLTAFLPKEKVITIFNKNLYSDSNLIPLYKQLAGIQDMKPFECVGTFEETKLALFLAFEKKEYPDDPVMKMFETEILPQIGDTVKLKKEILSPSSK